MSRRIFLALNLILISVRVTGFVPQTSRTQPILQQYQTVNQQTRKEINRETQDIPNAFRTLPKTPTRLHAEASQQETAAALTAYMAKAHEEKVAAMARVEAQYKDEIEALKAQVAELQGPTTATPSSTTNSFAFPATNRGLAEKIVSYQKFISKYIVKAQAEKQKAVKVAEQATAAKYETKIEAMLTPPSEPQFE